MLDKKIIWIALGLSSCMLLLYTICFWGAGLSKESSDWGSFGNYAAVCISMLSVALIYVTYREQRNTNVITRKEQQIATMTSTLVVLAEKNQAKCKELCIKILEHFDNPFYDMSLYDYKGVAKVCTYYYSSAMIENNNSENMNSFFMYMKLFFECIIRDNLLPKETIRQRVIETTCLLPESERILFLFWLLQNNCDVLEDYYRTGIFTIDDGDMSPLKDIISFICIKTYPQKRKKKDVHIDDIILDDLPNEKFDATYLRLNKNKKQ